MNHASGRRRVRCAGRAQGSDCDAPSCFASVIEDQVEALLARFAVNEDERERLLTAWRHHRGRDVAAAGSRARLERKLARLKELYLEGDLDKAAYLEKKAAIARELAILPVEGTADAAEAGERLAGFLADVSRAWAIADQAERNRIARQLFNSVVVTNRTAVAIVPRPDLGPFFITVAVNQSEKVCTGGSDGDRSHRCILPAGALIIAEPPERPRVGRSQRDASRDPRPRKLDADHLHVIEYLASQGLTLRQIAAEIGVSHETVRVALRRLEHVT